MFHYQHQSYQSVLSLGLFIHDYFRAVARHACKQYHNIGDYSGGSSGAVEFVAEDGDVHTSLRKLKMIERRDERNVNPKPRPSASRGNSLFPQNTPSVRSSASTRIRSTDPQTLPEPSAMSPECKALALDHEVRIRTAHLMKTITQWNQTTSTALMPLR